MQLVRFSADWNAYAAGDEATFNDPVASQLVRTGVAQFVAHPVVEPRAQQPQLELPAVSPVSDERSRRK